jgi:3-isopropylmalate/(R)-2-methylmalate dehydratase small subunit
MNKWKYKGKVWMFGDDINTDYMMPGFTPRGLSMQERTAYCMRAIRPDWNQQVKPGDIIMGGRNFGTGSNRPAPQILKLLKLSVLVADSINTLFLRNCVNFVMPALPCEGVSKAFKEEDIAEVDITTGVVKNLTTGVTLKTTPLPKFLLDIMEAGGMISMLEKEGYIEYNQESVEEEMSE